MITEYDLPSLLNTTTTPVDTLAVPKEFFFFFKKNGERNQLLTKYIYFKENRKVAINELLDVNILLSDPFLLPQIYPVSFSYFAFRINEYQKKHDKQAFSNTNELKKYFKYLTANIDPSFKEINNSYKNKEDFAREIFHSIGRL